MKSFLIYSGKGGVGKTTTSANIAKTLAAQGNKVFVIDADINTPSMGVIFGSEHPTENLWVASTSFLYKNLIYLEKSNVRQFLRNAVKKINEVKPDYLIIDTPPSITDIHLNLLEVLKVSAIVIVTQPNELSRTDVNRTAIFFTEKCPDAGCIVIENMCKETAPATYSWPCVEQIPFVDGFDGKKVFELFADKYERIVDYIAKMNPAEVRLEAQKRQLFDETITEDDIPYWDGGGRFARGISRSEVKFINVKTWDAVCERLIDMDSYFGAPDRRLLETTTERIERMLKPFEEDEEAYFLITNAPNTEIDLLPGEIGKGTLFVDNSYYGLPRIKYQTRQGEVVLFPNEIMPATDKIIAEAIEDGCTLLPEGRYIPSKEVMEQVYNAFGNRVGLDDNWEKKYDSIVHHSVKNREIKAVHSNIKNMAEQRSTNRKEYAKTKKFIAVVKMTDGLTTWDEDFKVAESDEDLARLEVDDVVYRFNNGLREGERERTIVKLIEIKADETRNSKSKKR